MEGVEIIKKWTGVREAILSPSDIFVSYDEKEDVVRLDPNDYKYVECARCNVMFLGFKQFRISAVPEEPMTCWLYKKDGERGAVCLDTPELFEYVI